MCGICGEWNPVDAVPDEAALVRMCESLAPRGPDGSGLRVRGRIALGHRRLKIIDLSEASDQPFVDEALGLSIVYNGAIYNYRELREELRAEGYRFRSEGDTEVLLKAFHAWGPSFVERLNGMFAFAIAEEGRDGLFLGRDRLGIKPLYYSWVGGRFRFASTLPALVAAGGVDTTLDPVALQDYLTFHSVVPAPRTILRGVRKFPPATVGWVQANEHLETREYWQVTYGPDPDRASSTEADWIEETREVLRRAVRRRLVADVPVGVLLSGGLDSSLIVGLLAEQHPDPLETFSIGFESVGGVEGDEFRYSDRVAEAFGTRHHQLSIGGSDTLPALRRAIGAMSEPMVSHDNVGFYLLSQEVSRYVKVVQSGQGADEIFAGYFWYERMLGSTHPVEDYASVFFDRDYADYARTVDPRWRVAEDHPLAFVREHFGRPGAERPVDQALRLDSRVMLVEDPVKRVDNHTMAASLEARVPFLDHEVVEFAARMPAELKVRDGGKYALKEAARSVLPAEVIDRPKGYFPVPALTYLEGRFLEMARDALTNETARARGLYQRETVDELLAAPGEHLTSLGGSKLYQLALLELWLQEQGIPA
jgi:asparagine synthase (glutamine-hydrolysing)